MRIPAAVKASIDAQTQEQTAAAREAFAAKLDAINAEKKAALKAAMPEMMARRAAFDAKLRG
jgi:hypothetical protein